MDLLQAWREWDPNSGPPYVLDIDREALKKLENANKAATYKSWKDAQKDTKYLKKLHMGLFPLPFVGNVAEASIYVLLSNPGLSDTDYCVGLDEEWLTTLYRQESADGLTPLRSFDPGEVDSGARKYFGRKLKRTAEHIASQRSESVDKSLAELSENVAFVNLTPYHSHRFIHQTRNLPSACLAMEFVVKSVVPRVRDEEAVLIVGRNVRNWNRDEQITRHLGDSDRLVLYSKGWEAQGAHLTPNSRAGKAILHHYGIDAPG